MTQRGVGKPWQLNTMHTQQETTITTFMRNHILLIEAEKDKKTTTKVSVETRNQESKQGNVRAESADI